MNYTIKKRETMQSFVPDTLLSKVCEGHTNLT